MYFFSVITGDLSKNCSHSDIAGEIRDCEVTQASKHFRGGLSGVSGKEKESEVSATTRIFFIEIKKLY